MDAVSRPAGVCGERWSVVVVGARLAGAVTAHALAPYAGRVLVLDRTTEAAFWPQQVTWDRHGNLAWQDLGLAGTVLACRAPRLLGHTRRTLDASVHYRYPADDGHCYRMSVPREVLDPALAARAASHPNVTVLRPARVGAVLRDAGRVTGVGYTYRGRRREALADLVVFADGRVGRGAYRVGAAAYRSVDSPWTALLSYHQDLPLPSDEVYFSRQPGSMLIVTPCGPSLWCVAAAMHRDLIAGRHPAAGYAATIATDPLIGPATAAGTRVTSVGGAGRLGMFRRPMAGPGWCLVGDSGYHLDPMSALGTQAVLRTVGLLRERVADRGRVSVEPAAYRGLTAARDALLERHWAFTERILHAYAPGADAVARARRLAADPVAAEAEMRSQMGLPPRVAVGARPAAG